MTRQEAIYAVYKVINSGIISMELEEELQEVANCIEANNFEIEDEDTRDCCGLCNE